MSLAVLKEMLHQFRKLEGKLNYYTYHTDISGGTCFACLEA